MEVELGLIGAFTLMGAAVQWRILKILQFKLRELGKELRRRDEELEAQATARFKDTEKDMADWEREHGRQDSHMSTLPLMKDSELHSPGTDESHTLLGDPRRSRHLSGMSEFKAAAPNEDEFGRPRDRRQSIGAIPALDLGGDIESDIPKDFVAGDSDSSMRRKNPSTPEEQEAAKKKEELMAEIQTIRKSIEQLRSTTPGASSISGGDTRSRHQSFTSRRTLSLGFAEAMEGPTRPPRSQDPRARYSSMDRLSQPMDSYMAGDSISRPSSVPLNDEVSWNEYVRERKLFQPPSGISAPIQSSIAEPQPRSPPVAVSSSVSEALLRRHQRESAIETGDFGMMRSSSHASSEDVPVALLKQQKSATVGTRPPVMILPPRKPDPTAQPQASRPQPQRVYTFEELNERHREKLRDLQAPLSKAEREQAELENARQRWERSKEIEKQVMAKKQAEKAAAAKQAEKRRHSNDDRNPKNAGDSHGHRRSLSADKLAKMSVPAPNPKRQSTMKVEDWMRYQQEVGGSSGQDSLRNSNVPFPAANAGREPGHGHSGNRRKSGQML